MLCAAGTTLLSNWRSSIPMRWICRPMLFDTDTLFAGFMISQPCVMLMNLLLSSRPLFMK